jgi:hypothetical protein
MGCAGRQDVEVVFADVSGNEIVPASNTLGWIYHPHPDRIVAVYLLDSVRAINVESIDSASGTFRENLYLDDIEGCEGATFVGFNSLLNNDIGYSAACYNDHPDNHRYYLYSWNLKDTQPLRLLTIDGFSPTSFAFSPDMKHVILERAGDGIFNTLYQYDTETEEVNPLFSNSDRAGSPAWSTEGIVFGASNLDDPSRQSPPAGQVGLGASMKEPWDIYFAPDLETEPELWLSNIKYLDYLAWLPNRPGNLLFRGEIDSRLGLWHFAKESQMLTFLWEEDSEGGRKVQFDASPDGRYIVLIDSTLNGAERLASAIRLDLDDILPSIPDDH